MTRDSLDTQTPRGDLLCFGRIIGTCDYGEFDADNTDFILIATEFRAAPWLRSLFPEMGTLLIELERGRLRVNDGPWLDIIECMSLSLLNERDIPLNDPEPTPETPTA